MKKILLSAAGILAFLLVGLVLWYAPLRCEARRADSSRPICTGLFARAVPAGERLQRFRPAETARPVAHVPPPQHPFMAANPGSNMHNDASMSDTSEAPGPLGLEAVVRSRSQGFGGYGTLAFDRSGRIVGVYSNGRKFRLDLLDPGTLEALATFDLPPRSWNFLLQGVMPWEYIGAGVYFYLDEQDRAVVPTTRNTVQVIQAPGPEAGEGFRLVREYDLRDQVVPLPWPKQDSVAWVLPEWSGDYLWYATTAGMVGTIQADGGAVHTLRLDGEIIENSFAIGPDGLFILSDHALYRFERDAQGAIATGWRAAYDRGPHQKPGHITRGSGTSVTLIGGPEGVVVVTDNAEPQIHLLYLRRSDGEVLCSQPLFTPGRSGTDITTLGVELAGEDGRPTGAYAAIVENNWGRNFFPFAFQEGGITRVDLEPGSQGAYTCREVWTSPETNIGVPKLSLGSGLLYTYYRGGSALDLKWYLTALDFTTGQTAYKQLVGTGMGFNNWAGALFLDPQGGRLYSTTIFGLVMVQDAP